MKKIGVRITALILVIVMMIPMTAFASYDYTDTATYFYSQLDETEKKFYDILFGLDLSELVDTDEPTYMFGIGIDDFYDISYDETYAKMQRAISAVLADHPVIQEYWIGLGYIDQLDSEIDVVLRRNTYAQTFYLSKAASAENTILNTVGASGDTYTRVRKLADYINRNMIYAPGGTVNSSVLNQTPLGCLCNNQAVCEGFAATVKLLCDELGIPCIIVGDFAHAWNYIRMDDGNWYNLDLTNYNYVPTEVDQYLLIGSTDYNYVHHGLYSEDLYLATPGDFDFPSLSTTRYVYKGSNTDFSYDGLEDDFSWDDQYSYEVNPDGVSCTITNFVSTSDGDLTIPNQIDGYIVTSIGDAAFRNCTSFDGSLTIPDTVTYIGDSAFYGCSNLTGTLTLPSNLEYIGTSAFMSCANLSGSIVFPETLLRVGNTAFQGCSNLTGDIIFPRNTSVGSKVFYECYNLDGILRLSDNVDFTRVFATQTKISSIEVYDTNTQYTSIDGILYSADGTTLVWCPVGRTAAINIPEGVTTIGDHAIVECQNIKSPLVLPSTLTRVEDFGCYNNRFVGPLVIPDSVEYIGALAFSGNVNHVTVTVGRNVQYVGDRALGSSFREIIFLCENATIEPDAWMDLTTVYGVEGTAAETYASNGGATFVPIIVTADGYELKTSESDGGTEVPVEPDPTPEEYTITFETGTGASVDAQTTVDGKLTSIPSLTRDGYNFLGWKTFAGVEITSDTVFGADTIIYAQWQQIQTTPEIPSEPEDPIVDFEITDAQIDGGTVQVTISQKGNVSEGLIVVASYTENNQMIDIQMTSFEVETIITMPVNVDFTSASCVKIYILKDAQSMVPVTDAVTLTIETETEEPNTDPSSNPTMRPSDNPTTEPSEGPTETETSEENPTTSTNPTTTPSDLPTAEPSDLPTTKPAEQPSNPSSEQSSTTPTTTPSTQPSSEPTTTPTKNPSPRPTYQPTYPIYHDPTPTETSKPEETSNINTGKIVNFEDDPTRKVVAVQESGTAYASSQEVAIDGVPVVFPMYALKGADGGISNYIRIRDLAYVLDNTDAKFEIYWDGKLGKITLLSGEHYTKGSSEMNAPFSEDMPYQASRFIVVVNGEYVDLNAFVLYDKEGGGYTYFRLRDLGQLLGFNVGWDPDLGVYIETNKPYDPED